MQFIDPHTHLVNLSDLDLEQMYLSGIRTIISPSHLPAAKALGSETIIDIWDYLLEVQFARAEKNMIKAYGMIGLSMVSTPKGDPSYLYKILPQYLKRSDVVAIGEIGLDPYSGTCKDLKHQEKYVNRQLEIAKKENICVNFHTPNRRDDKFKITNRLVDLCRDHKILMHKVIFDHCTDANMSIALDSGAWASITVQPWRNISPEIGAKTIKIYGTERTMIDSDCGTSKSDSLSVAKTAMEMKRLGINDNDINKTCYCNSKKAYGI